MRLPALSLPSLTLLLIFRTGAGGGLKLFEGGFCLFVCLFFERESLSELTLSHDYQLLYDGILLIVRLYFNNEIHRKSVFDESVKQRCSLNSNCLFY